MPTRKVAVIAIGGNSLILSKDAQTVQDQYRALCVTGKHIVSLVELGYQVVVTYGNGPQVGFLLWRSEVAHATSGLHGLPLVTCVADTQGGIGYQIQQTLKNEFLRRGLCEDSIAVLTQVVVDKNDPGFRNPTKPVGEFYPPERAEVLRRENPSWVLREDAGRGFRRYVPSPRPLEIVEEAGLKTLLASGLHLIAGGGGGIPVFRTEGGYEGVDAVVDKDLTSCLLAKRIERAVCFPRSWRRWTSSGQPARRPSSPRRKTSAPRSWKARGRISSLDRSPIFREDGISAAPCAFWERSGRFYEEKKRQGVAERGLIRYDKPK